MAAASPGGGNSGTLNLSLLTSCASGQILKWNGSAWACSSDANSGGTVTSVGLSASSGDFAVTGSPVTTSGTLGLSWGTNPPTSSNMANAIVRRDASGSFNLTNLNAAGTLSVNTANGSGISAQSSNTSATTIYGAATSTNGPAWGVLGETFSSNGIGVIGWSATTSGGIGVEGYANTATGTAALFQNYGKGKIISGVNQTSEVFSVAGDGTVKAAGPVIGPSGTAIPLAFASVSSNRSKQAGTSNCTSAYNSTTGLYELTITSVTFSRTQFTTVATISGYNGKPYFINTDDNGAGKLIVAIRDANGNLQTADFQVVVFQAH